MTTAIAIRDGYSDEQLALIKRTICQGATDDELQLFVQAANRLRLDPFARQIFAVKRWDSKQGREVMAIQVSVDGFRLVAERTGKYAGQLGPFWSNDGKEWLEVWLDSNPPKAAKVGVLRSDFKEPLWAVATWDQYKQEGSKGLAPMWKKMPATMLAKCSESLALRRAFPNELSGVYSVEEMAQAESAEPEYQPPSGPNVPMPNKRGKGSWPKHVPETSAAEDAALAMDAQYRASMRGEVPLDPADYQEPPASEIVDEHTVLVMDEVTKQRVKQPRPSAEMMRKLNVLRRECNIDDKAWRAGMQKYYKVDSSTLLSKAQCADMISRLELTKDKAVKAMADIADAVGKIKGVFKDAKEVEDEDEVNRRNAAPGPDESPEGK